MTRPANRQESERGRCETETKGNMPAKKNSSKNPVWGKKSSPGRGPKPSLTAAQIASAAIQLADTEGLEGVTMQRVAQEIGLTTMAIYRYFSSKADLLALMIDSASDSAPVFGKPSLHWDLRLKKWARRCLEIYRNHPWFLEATSARHGLMGPNELSWMEAALTMLTESGLAPRARHYAFLALIAHVRGHATFQNLPKVDGFAQQWRHDFEQMLGEEASRFPALLASVRSGAFSGRSDAAFDFGLDCILMGIQAHVTRSDQSRRSSKIR